MPSLYLKKDYGTNFGGTFVSRQGSVERGVASMSKDQNMSVSQGKTGILKHNNFMETSNNRESRDKLGGSQERPPSSSVQRGSVVRPVVRGSDNRSRDTLKREEVTSLNNSVDKLKQTFLQTKTIQPSTLETERGKAEKKTGSSTRCTNEQDGITIQWRDDIVLDVEKELTFTSCLGQGSFAKVYEGYDKRLKMPVAIKVIDKRKVLEPKRRSLIQTEVNILARMKHKNIAEFYRLIEDHKRLFIVMQLCGSLTLNVFCRQFADKRLNEEQAYALFSQIMKGVKYMHEHNVAHRDLKLTNILIDEEYAVKIIDFGFACEANDLHRMYCGTPSYMAPEIVEKKHYLPKPTDVWSVGVVLYKLLSGEYAFGAEDHPELKKNIVNVRVEFPPYFSTKVKSLLLGCFEYDPEKRLTVEAVFEHPWMQKYRNLI